MKTRYHSWLGYKCLSKSWTFLHFDFFCDYSKCPQPWLHKQNHPRQESARLKPQGKRKTRAYWFKLPHHLITVGFCWGCGGGGCPPLPQTIWAFSGHSIHLSRPNTSFTFQNRHWQSCSAHLLWKNGNLYTMKVILLNCYRKLPNPMQSREKGETAALVALNIFPTSLCWPY